MKRIELTEDIEQTVIEINTNYGSLILLEANEIDLMGDSLFLSKLTTELTKGEYKDFQILIKSDRVSYKNLLRWNQWCVQENLAALSLQYNHPLDLPFEIFPEQLEHVVCVKLPHVNVNDDFDVQKTVIDKIFKMCPNITQLFVSLVGKSIYEFDDFGYLLPLIGYEQLDYIHIENTPHKEDVEQQIFSYLAKSGNDVSVTFDSSMTIKAENDSLNSSLSMSYA